MAQLPGHHGKWRSRLNQLTRTKYCATVSALRTSDRKAEKQLIALVEKFTTSHHLQLVGVQQADTNEYQDKTTTLDLSLGVGSFGSVVTLFYKGSTGDGVKTELNSYLVQHVSPIFKVRQCSDIPGFKTPELSNENK